MKYYILTSTSKNFLADKFAGMPYTKWNSKFPIGMKANPKFDFTELKNDKFGLIETVVQSEDVLNFFNTFTQEIKDQINEILASAELREVLPEEYKYALND